MLQLKGACLESDGFPPQTKRPLSGKWVKTWQITLFVQFTILDWASRISIRPARRGYTWSNDENTKKSIETGGVSREALSEWLVFDKKIWNLTIFLYSQTPCLFVYKFSFLIFFPSIFTLNIFASRHFRTPTKTCFRWVRLLVWASYIITVSLAPPRNGSSLGGWLQHPRLSSNSPTLIVKFNTAG